MSVPKTLLYPFSIDHPYFEGYAWACELAQRMKARLQVFTTSPVQPVATRSVYHSLLEAHGYYMEHYPHTRAQSSEVLAEPHIAAGELEIELVSHLKTNPVDIVIIDPFMSATLAQELSEIIRQSGGVIVLPPEKGGSSTPPSSEKFYDDLRRARLYKLPSNFFFTLGKDHSAFNYLRKFFQKNRF